MHKKCGSPVLCILLAVDEETSNLVVRVKAGSGLVGAKETHANSTNSANRSVADFILLLGLGILADGTTKEVLGTSN